VNERAAAGAVSTASSLNARQIDASRDGTAVHRTPSGEKPLKRLTATTGTPLKPGVNERGERVLASCGKIIFFSASARWGSLVSLTPGFSPVNERAAAGAVSTASAMNARQMGHKPTRHGGPSQALRLKAVETAHCHHRRPHTPLKRGVNERWSALLLNPQEDFPPVHPEQDEPGDEQGGRSVQERFVSITEECENFGAEVSAEIAVDEIVKEMVAAVGGNRVHADHDEGERPGLFSP
jgi:hypothetical protein